MTEKKAPAKAAGYKYYDKLKLAEALQGLTGRDFAIAEKEARRMGDQSIDICLSRTFFAAVAARCFKVPTEDILGLTIREYTLITGDVGSFLLTPTGQGTEVTAPSIAG